MIESIVIYEIIQKRHMILWSTYTVASRDRCPGAPGGTPGQIDMTRGYNKCAVRVPGNLRPWGQGGALAQEWEYCTYQHWFDWSC